MADDTDNRPLSPHLQIYRPQWTSVLSISHRATGVVLSVGALYFTWWLVAVAAGGDAYEGFAWFAGSFVGLIFLFFWTFSLFYHLSNGIRHLVWDSGHWLELESAYRSGLVVVAVASALTVLAWIIGLVAW